jgi:hypothetical protein
VGYLEITMDTKTTAYDINFDLDELKDHGINIYVKLDTLTISYPGGYNENLLNFLDHIPKNLTPQEQADMIDVINEAYVGIMITRIFKAVGKFSK